MAKGLAKIAAAEQQEALAKPVQPSCARKAERSRAVPSRSLSAIACSTSLKATLLLIEAGAATLRLRSPRVSDHSR